MEACAKFILAGEHSVVFKGRALAFALPNKKLRVEDLSDRTGLWFNSKKIDEPLLWEKIQTLRKLMGSAHPSPGLAIDSQIPIGGGLGSSASLCVALARLYTSHRERALAEKAFEGEGLFHAQPSGIDPYTIAFERSLVFTSKDRSFLDLNIDPFREQKFSFVLADSGMVHSTLEVQKQVGLFRRESPQAFQEKMDGLAQNVEAMLEIIESKELSELGAVINNSHQKLKDLGLSNPGIENKIARFLKEGALGAKITGAGCGGFVLALFRNRDLPRLRQQWPDLIEWSAS